MSTQYQSSRDVPTEVLAARLNELADVVAQKRDRIGAEFTMRIPAECDRDADLVMSEAAVRLEALQTEYDELRARTRMSLGVGDGSGNLFVHGDYDSIKRVQALIFECEQLRKDAERYRWLREQCGSRGPLTIAKVGTFELAAWSGDDPDAAIDAAMEATK